MNSAVKLSALALACAAVLAGCGKNDAPAPKAADDQAVVVKLAHAAPLTGPQSHLGKDTENGVRLAVEELNAQKLKIGGKNVHFELMAEDDQADPKQGTVVAQKFVDAKVNAVIGHLNSGTTVPASRLYSDAGIPQVTVSTAPIYTNQGFKTTFRSIANDVQQGKVLAYIAAKRLNAKRVAIIDDRTAYGQGLGDEFNKAVRAQGAEVIAHEFTNDKATDFKAILTTIKSKKPDLIFFAGLDPQAGPLMRQTKELGIQAKLLTGEGGCTREAAKLAGEAANGSYCTQHGLPIDRMAGGRAFREKFKARWKQDVQMYAPYLYDATMVIAEAMKRADSVDRAKILAAMPQTDYEGVTGRIQFDAKGDIKSGVVSFYVFKNGNPEFVEALNSGDAESGKSATSSK